MVNETTYTFDVFGLYNGLFVMADRISGSVWTHYDGRVLTGELAGKDFLLQIEPIIHTTWEQWVSLYPETTVLDWYPEFVDRYRKIEPGRGGLGPQFQRTLLNIDERLPGNELVLGVSSGSSERAYVLADFGEQPTVLHDTLGEQPIVIFLHGKNTYALAFSRQVVGEVLQFSMEGESIVDASGTQWDWTGRAVAGPLEGAQLDYVTSFVTEWYGWAAYHPGTSIFGR